MLRVGFFSWELSKCTELHPNVTWTLISKLVLQSCGESFVVQLQHPGLAFVLKFEDKGTRCPCQNSAQWQHHWDQWHWQLHLSTDSVLPSNHKTPGLVCDILNPSMFLTSKLFSPGSFCVSYCGKQQDNNFVHCAHVTDRGWSTGMELHGRDFFVSGSQTVNCFVSVFVTLKNYWWIFAG